MIKFKNINGDVFLAVGSIKRKSALNGEKSLTGTLFEGDDVLNKIDKGWSLEFDNEPYVVTYFERNDNNNTVEFDAIHKFFWDMNKSVLYSSASGSHTAKWYLDQIFNGTGYTYALNFDPSAFEKENWGMKNKLSLFNDAISGMGGEFEINGTLVSIFKNIGSDLSTIVRHGFNLSDMSLENDNTDFVTYGEGFGAYANQENQTGERLHVTYTSPLAKTFGKLHAEPIDDERYTIKDNLLQAIKDKVDGSFAISIKLSLYDLTAAGYPYKMANVGDWLLAIDENLDFKQKIRIISVDDEFATDGTRISYTVTCGDIGVVQKYQQANASLGQKVDSAYQNAQDAKESSIQAVIAANGKNTNYYVDGVENLPTTANEGDIAFVQTGDGQAMYIWTKMPDGSFKWVKRVDPDTGEQIAAGVDSAIETANSQAAAAIEQNNASQQEVMNDIAKSQANLAIKDGDFNNKAQAMADKALSDAKANAANVAQETLNSANQNIADAKKSLSDSIASEASERQQAVQTVNSQAQSYANQAKSDAIAAAETADGVVRKDFKATTDSLSSTITQNKQDSDGKISTAQSTATQALNGLSTKVSQTDYDKKTGDLSTNVNTVTQTANETKNELANVSKTVDSQSSKINTISNTVDGTTQTISDIQKEQGKQSGSIATLQQRADGFDGTVAKIQMSVNDLGQVNLLNNTEFNPNLEGWSINQSGGAQLPYRSYVQNDLKSVVVSFDTTNTTSVAYTRFVQNFKLASVPSSGNKISISWASYAKRVDNYNNVWIHFYDVNGKDVYSTYKAWSAIGNDNTWGNRKKWEGITIPDTATSVVISFEVREGTQADLGQPMVTYGATIGDYVPGNYNNNDSLSQVKLTADQATLSINNYKTDADGRIRKAQADIEVNANAITQKVSQSVYDKKTGDLTTSVNNAQSTADTATQTIGTYKETNDKRVASAETNIKANSDAIKLTVSKTDFDEKTGQLSGDVTSLKERANGFDATVTKVNNLQVGGKNLYINTKNFDNLASWFGSNVWAKTTDTYNGLAVMQTTQDWNGLSQYIQVKKGDVLTYSIYAKYTSGTGTSTIYWNLNNQTEGSYSTATSNPSYKDVTITDSWQRISMTTVATSDGYLRPRLERTARNSNTLKIAGIKVEKGNLPTDWSPAPEDTENKISTVSQTVDSISSIVSDPTTGLTKRVQTAEGLLTQVRGTDIPNLQKATFWQPYSSLNFNDYTKQGSFFFNTSSAKTNGPTTSTSWIYLIVEQGTTDNSRIKQTAWYDGVSGVKITYVRTLNSGTWSPWYANDNDSVATISHTNESIKKEIENRTTGDKNTFESSKDFTSSEISKSETNMKSLIDQKADSIIIGTMSNSIDQLKSVTNWQEISFNNLDYLQQTGNYLITQSDNTNFPPGVTAWVYLKVESPRSDRVTQTLWKDLNATQSYVRTLNGTNWSAWSQQVTSSTILGIFKDSWSLGTSTNDGITKQMITGIMGQPDGTLILKGNSLILDGNTTVTGDFYAKGGNFKNLNASNITTGTIDASDGRIINLDVKYLSGDSTNFVKSRWDNAYSNVSIDSSGMEINTNNEYAKLTQGSLVLKSFNSTTNVKENIGWVTHTKAGGANWVDYLAIVLDGYSDNQASGVDHSALHGADGFSININEGGNGNSRSLIEWASTQAGRITGKDSGWHVQDRLYPEKGLYAPTAREHWRVSWTAWSDWGNYRNVSLTNPNGSAGIAVNDNNLILFGTNKRTDGTKGWNV